MAEGLKLKVTADLSEAEAGLKNFVGTAGREGKAAGVALGKGLNTVTPVIQKIPQTVRPAIQAVSKLGDTLETLQGKLGARKSFLNTEKDIVKVAALNLEIKALEKEIIRVQGIGTQGANLGGVGKAANAGFGALRKAAFILPGIGVAGILGGITDGLVSLFSSADKANEKIKELLVSVSSIGAEAGAGTQGETAKVNALANVVLNLNKSYTERNRALNELKGINKNYFGDLSLEASSLALLRDRVNEYTGALIQQAIIKKFSDQIADVAVQLSKQGQELAGTTAKVKALQRQAEKLNGDDFFFKKIDINDANSDLQKQSGIFNTLIDQQKKLRAALGSAVEESLKFKPLDDKETKTKTDNIIADAKRLAAFLNKTTQFAVNFEVDEFKSDDQNKQAARDFIAKAKEFFIQQTSKKGVFDFKPLVRTSFEFIRDGKFLNNIKEQAGIEATKTFSEIKKEFEANIKNLAENNPFVIKVSTELSAGRRQEDLRRQALASGVGIKPVDLGPLGTPVLSDIDKKAVAAANTLNDTLTPAFQGLFSAIKAGENPLKSFFDGIGQAVEQLIQKLIAAAVQALILSAIFPAGVGGVKGFGGFFKSILGFASGGIVSGPQLALIGEGVGTSRSNPEVVAPLDQLRSILSSVGGGQGQVVVVNGRTRGNEFELLASRTNKSNKRLGR